MSLSGKGDPAQGAEGRPPRLCECGCGLPAPIATMTKTSAGYVKGQPKRFIHGHHARKNNPALKHGQARAVGFSPEYRAYRAAQSRCRRSNTRNQKWYAGVKFLFTSFEQWFAELGPRPTPQHSVDRYPNQNGNYEPGNVRWATKSEQVHNRRPYRKQLLTSQPIKEQVA